MRTTLTKFACCIILLSTVQCYAESDTASNRFKDIYIKEWAWRQTEIGEVDEETEQNVSASLPRVSYLVQESKRRYWIGVVDQLNKINTAELSASEQVDFAVYKMQIASLLHNQEFRDYEKPLNADSAFWSDLTYIAKVPMSRSLDFERYLAQLSDMPRYFSEQIENMRSGLQRGFTPPRVTLLGRDTSVESVINVPNIEGNIYFAPFIKMPDSVPITEQVRLREAAIKAVREFVLPSHKLLLQFLRAEYFPQSRQDLSAESLPDGKAYYQSKIEEFTTLTLSPDDIHEIGLIEIAKIRREMGDVIRQVGFKGDIPAFLQFLRSDIQFYAKTPEELLMRAAFIAKKFDGKAAAYFGYLPRRRFAIKPVPDDQAPFYTSGRGGPGIYLVNTYDLPSRGLYSLPALTLHESAPGHAFQMPVAMEQKGRPEFRQVYLSAYGEGWALYAERLGVEMGMYDSPYELFGMLSYQAWRAARLVVDTGIHTKGWSREQAQKYLRENTALSMHEVETEVDRYISWPAQALSYYLGEMTIWKVRRKAEAALKEKFDIRNFHDTVLELGSVPLSVLEQRIDRFISEGGKSPYPEMK